MSDIFKSSVVVTDDNWAIPFIHIECMKMYRSSEDETVDKLKGDATIDIHTISGRQYTISMLKQISSLPKSMNITTNIFTLREAIFNRWLYMKNKQENT